MSAFVLKIIACVTMFIDHISYAIPGDTSILNYIGRFAFPIFAFQISEGYIHTSNEKKYIIRLLFFALISQYPFMLFHSLISTDFALNVLFTLLFGLISIIIYDKYNKYIGIVSVFYLGLIAEFACFDYGFYGVLIIFLFYILKNNRTSFILSFEIATLIHFAYEVLPYYRYGTEILVKAFIYYIPYIIFTMLAIVPILFYNKQKGINTKHLLYLFYPLHLILIYAISIII